MGDDTPKTVTQVFSVTPELLEKAESKDESLAFLLQNAHRPGVDPHKFYTIELEDPTLRISYSTEIDRNKLH
ncbi:hypothetical protein SAMN04488118_1282 [Epibacterium ulvae]|uniref:Uncharacterized protein n=1 Tax=Epibacterium ulvae TaxID=1156985 RepID=A0A1G5RKI3_9RHOB|nr:hypothetical protein [Epibacterium ulvae]SCZ74330.1 hypothetical protein SAMN04488118_1282 [Epibacterium ulvae]